jgi:starch-binding outer membrane protein, SusD/RagB family
MKSITNILLVISLVLAACNKKLDVLPQNTVPSDQIKTEDDVRAVLFGAYSTWQNANAFGEKYNTFSELLVQGGDIDWAGTFETYGDLHQNSQVRTAPEIYQVWANSYHTIAAANIVLNKIDILNGAEKAEVEGEAKFLRGVTYYALVNLFALPYVDGAANSGVPLILQPVEGFIPERDKLARASVGEVYTQIVSDLTDAAAKMPEASDDFRADKYSALAFLSRVYLSQAKYAEAATAADDVIENSGRSLASTFDKAFNNASNSTEDLFAIQQTSQSNSGTTNFGMAAFYTADPEGRGEIQVAASHLAKYEANDDRGSFFYDGSSISGTDGIFTGKWQQLYRAIPVIRLAEMYLTRAEANFRKGGTPVGANTPLQDVNIIRDRAGLGNLTSIADADIIIKERYLELAFEGERFYTVKRLKITTGGNPYNDPKMVLPIPQREIDLGNALPQNPGY